MSTFENCNRFVSTSQTNEFSQQNGHLKWLEVYQNRDNNINNSKKERFGIFELDQNDRVYPYRFVKVIA